MEIRFVTQEEARGLGLRKLPPIEKDELRLIDIRDFDLTACGGTHVQGTAQIGCILLRKTEKVRQGWRVEFVCGKRAVSTARRDYTTLAERGGRSLRPTLGRSPADPEVAGGVAGCAKIPRTVARRAGRAPRRAHALRNAEDR